MNVQQVSDTKKEDFRKYLERNGIVDALTKVLVGLYEHPDKPENPLEFIKQFLGGPGDADVEVLKAENKDLRRHVDDLTARVDDLTKRLIAAGITPPPVPAGSSLAGAGAGDAAAESGLSEGGVAGGDTVVGAGEGGAVGVPAPAAS
ncbi:hypothetical protein GGF31_008896 [Allomyces arbusculus]|nr:hypothetical protein GGF31_008896 [Allomyces arbusculus]